MIALATLATGTAAASPTPDGAPAPANPTVSPDPVPPAAPAEESAPVQQQPPAAVVEESPREVVPQEVIEAPTEGTSSGAPISSSSPAEDVVQNGASAIARQPPARQARPERARAKDARRERAERVRLAPAITRPLFAAPVTDVASHPSVLPVGLGLLALVLVSGGFLLVTTRMVRADA